MLIKHISASYQIKDSESNALFLVDLSTESINLYLPYAISGDEIYIKTISGSNNLNLYPKGLDLIENSSSIRIKNNLEKARIISDKNNKWWIISGGSSQEGINYIIYL